MPIRKKATNPNIIAFPFRHKSRSPTKRGQSPSPDKQSPDDQTAEDESTIPAPPTINKEVARKSMSEFRGAALIVSSSCAISGLGREFRGCPVRPGLQACHIVSQLQYNLYPLSKDDLNDLPLVAAASAAVPQDRLQEQWTRTWSVSNSLTLMSHLHEAFDQRLISIHPDTNVIRAFVEYDALLLYHGKTAQFGDSLPPDPLALFQHWKACCIENMGAFAADPTEAAAPSLPGSTTSATTPSLAASGSAPPDGDGDDVRQDDVAPKRRMPQQVWPSSSGLRHQELSRATGEAGRDGDDRHDARGRTALPDSGVGSAEGTGAGNNTGGLSSYPPGKRRWDSRADDAEHQHQQDPVQKKRKAAAEYAVATERQRTGDWAWDNARFLTPYNAEQFMVELQWKLRNHRNI